MLAQLKSALSIAAGNEKSGNGWRTWCFDGQECLLQQLSSAEFTFSFGDTYRIRREFRRHMHRQPVAQQHPGHISSPADFTRNESECTYNCVVR